jgi:hypothetical protein
MQNYLHNDESFSSMLQEDDIEISFGDDFPSYSYLLSLERTNPETVSDSLVLYLCMSGLPIGSFPLPCMHACITHLLSLLPFYAPSPCCVGSRSLLCEEHAII